MHGREHYAHLVTRVEVEFGGSSDCAWPNGKTKREKLSVLSAGSVSVNELHEVGAVSAHELPIMCA